MCDYDTGDRCAIWTETRPKARRQHRCCACHGPIYPGETYLSVAYLHEGSWGRHTAHQSCDDLVQYIAHDVCDQDTYMLDRPEGLRALVREHYPEAPALLSMWAAWLRERRAVVREVADVG